MKNEFACPALVSKNKTKHRSSRINLKNDDIMACVTSSIFFSQSSVPVLVYPSTQTHIVVLLSDKIPESPIFFIWHEALITRM